MNDISVTQAPVDAETASLGFRLRKAMPPALKVAYRFASALHQTIGGLAYDMLRFARYSGTFTKDSNVGSRKAEITKRYHTIEKGLALPAPRPGFGRQMNIDLSLKVQSAIRAGIRDPEIDHAVDALAGYAAFNDENGIANFSELGETLALAASHGIEPRGTPTRTPATLAALSGQERLDFITSRHSVRHFSTADVPDTVLENATRAAQSAPCVCNRQASRVYFAKDPAIKARMLACQNGNRGFGDKTPVVALVTVDLQSFLDASERYQAWIDGGLFTMNLLLGIHAQDYGACCLNWSALPKQDKALRKLGIIPPNETVITMVAIGGLRDDYVVARSQRPAAESVMTII